jgi:hypothetical protein
LARQKVNSRVECRNASDGDPADDSTQRSSADSVPVPPVREYYGQDFGRVRRGEGRRDRRCRRRRLFQSG